MAIQQYPTYTMYSDEQLSRIGNVIIYLSGKIAKLSKTKLLKLLYMLDEASILQSGIPFLNLSYKVWKFGPVAESIFVDLSADQIAGPLSAFVQKDHEGYLRPKQTFDDGEFSDNELSLLDGIITEYGSKSAAELVRYTHAPGGLWYQKAKQNDVLELLETERISNTDLTIDLGDLVRDDPRKRQLYADYIEQF